MADGQVVFEITGDNKPIQRSLADTTKAIQSESKKWDDTVDDSSGKISDSLIGAFKAVTASAAFIKVGQMLAQLAGESIELASDLQEVQNVVDSAFGTEGAKKVDKWAEDARKNFGLTELQAKRYASTMGAIFRTNGFADDQLVKMSTDIAGLAADMASFYNMDFDTAFNKIQSGLSGMPQPLREIGVEMTEAAVSAYAMANGYETAFDKMSESEKLLVRYQYLMSKTSLAQGDFAKTSDDFANSQRRMQTGFDTLKSQLGEALLPIATTVSNAIDDLLDLLLYKPPETAFDVAEESITDATRAATQAQGILGYMDQLQEKYGEEAKGTEEWAQALDHLKEVFPDVNQFIDAETGALTATNEQLRAYIENSKQAAIEDAKKAALQGLSDQYVQAGQQYYTAEINRDMAKAQADQARQDLINYIRRSDENFTGTGASIEQLEYAAQSVANEFGESQDTIAEWVRIYNEQTTAAEGFGTEMETLQSTMKSLESDLNVATAALDRMAAAAQSAASSLGGLPASAYMNSGQYYNALYGGKINGSHASGLDYVPFDGYIAMLHRGERIQTAAEASLARMHGMYTPGSEVLNDIISGNIDRIKTGGNVYLDGRVVGQVVSNMQGRSYRSLQRSGWQG